MSLSRNFFDRISTSKTSKPKTNNKPQAQRTFTMTAPIGKKADDIVSTTRSEMRASEIHAQIQAKYANGTLIHVTTPKLKEQKKAFILAYIKDGDLATDNRIIETTTYKGTIQTYDPKDQTPLLNIELIKGDMFDSDAPNIMCFSNASLGGGVLSNGSLQEEILMLKYPELLILPINQRVLDQDEAIIVRNVKEVSKHTGYKDTLKFASKTTTTQFRNIICVDAFDFSKNAEDQQSVSMINREINKLHCAWYSCKDSSIASGGWGTGGFKGQTQLKFMIQSYVASKLNIKVKYYTNSQIEIDQLTKLQETIQQQYPTLGQLYAHMTNKDNPNKNNIIKNMMDTIPQPKPSPSILNDEAIIINTLFDCELSKQWTINEGKIYLTAPFCPHGIDTVLTTSKTQALCGADYVWSTPGEIKIGLDRLLLRGCTKCIAPEVTTKITDKYKNMLIKLKYAKEEKLQTETIPMGVVVYIPKSSEERYITNPTELVNEIIKQSKFIGFEKVLYAQGLTKVADAIIASGYAAEMGSDDTLLDGRLTIDPVNSVETTDSSDSEDEDAIQIEQSNDQLAEVHGDEHAVPYTTSDGVIDITPSGKENETRDDEESLLSSENGSESQASRPRTPAPSYEIPSPQGVDESLSYYIPELRERKHAFGYINVILNQRNMYSNDLSLNIAHEKAFEFYASKMNDAPVGSVFHFAPPETSNNPLMLKNEITLKWLSQSSYIQAQAIVAGSLTMAMIKNTTIKGAYVILSDHDGVTITIRKESMGEAEPHPMVYEEAPAMECVTAYIEQVPEGEEAEVSQTIEKAPNSYYIPAINSRRHMIPIVRALRDNDHSRNTQAMSFGIEASFKYSKTKLEKMEVGQIARIGSNSEAQVSDLVLEHNLIEPWIERQHRLHNVPLYSCLDTVAKEYAAAFLTNDTVVGTYAVSFTTTHVIVEKVAM